MSRILLQITIGNDGLECSWARADCPCRRRGPEWHGLTAWVYIWLPFIEALSYAWMLRISQKTSGQSCNDRHYREPRIQTGSTQTTLHSSTLLYCICAQPLHLLYICAQPLHLSMHGLYSCAQLLHMCTASTYVHSLYIYAQPLHLCTASTSVHSLYICAQPPHLCTTLVAVGGPITSEEVVDTNPRAISSYEIQLRFFAANMA